MRYIPHMLPELHPLRTAHRIAPIHLDLVFLPALDRIMMQRYAIPRDRLSKCPMIYILSVLSDQMCTILEIECMGIDRAVVF